MSAVRWIGTGDQVQEVPARLCTWCPRPHWLTLDDLLRSTAGARTESRMCARAQRSFDAEGEALLGYGNGHA